MTQIRVSLRCLGLFASLCLPLAAADNDSVTQRPFGNADGQPVTLYTMTNAHGMSVSIMNYGATVVKLLVPDRAGKTDDIVLGFDDLSGYLGEKGGPYFGATIGRYGNRIAKGKFSLDGHTYQLATNDGPNALHGGKKGFDKQVWEAKIASTNPPSLLFVRISPDGEEGYPGTLKALVRVTLTEENELKFFYTAKTDKPTVVNLTHHGYFNLGGEGSGTILDELLTLNSKAYTAVDSTLIPTGEIKSVEGTPMDFRKPTAVGDRIQQVGGKPIGYDHNYVLNDYEKGVRVIATVQDPQSGRIMTVSSDQPGVQFYSGNFLDGTLHGKNGHVYQQYDALCLEPQHFPDSPNEPKFPSVILKPGSTYHSTIIYAFSIAK